jgi:hypothetical protein
LVPQLFVIDDFFPDPDAIRAQALSMRYAVSGRFPGLNSTEKLRIEGLDELIANIVRVPLKAPWDDSFSHAHFRVSLAEHNDQPARIHIDQSHWSGILYLSRPEDCQGGTEFFRHLPTKTDRLPLTPAELRAAGYDDYDSLRAQILDQDALDRSKWERTMTVPMRYNRLILLQPQYWHTAGRGFGTTLDNGRLVYLLFYLRA